MEEEGPPPWENWTFLPLNDLRFNSPQGMAIVGSMLYLAGDGGPGAGNGEGFSRVYAIDLADSCRRKYVIRASGSRVAGPALRPTAEDPRTFPDHPEDALKCVRGITAHAGVRGRRARRYRPRLLVRERRVAARRRLWAAPTLRAVRRARHALRHRVRGRCSQRLRRGHRRLRAARAPRLLG